MDIVVDYTEDGEPVYSAMPELPGGWDESDEERWALYDEAMASIGWSDCR